MTMTLPLARPQARPRPAITAPAPAPAPLAVPVPVPVPAAAARPNRAARLLVGLGLALLPWLVVLATTLPATTTVSHWSLAWVGLDCLEAVGLISTGVLLRRGDPRRCLTAMATSVLLVCDAWFDVTTSAPGAEVASALAMALLVELPLALFCARLAVRALPRG